MSPITIQRVSPQAGVRGGRVKVFCDGLDAQALEACRLVFGARQTRTALVTPTFVLGTVPEDANPNSLQIVQGSTSSNAVPFPVATVLADNLHPVANPVVDSSGNIYTTISGTKGQQVPVSLYKITPFGEVEPFASGLINPTSLAVGPDGDLYVSSRHAGTVSRVDAQGTVTTFAERLGIATGLAFDTQGRLYVGDRRGTVYQVLEAGEARAFARLEPSVGSYHLAFGDEAQLYVSYPTLSGYDQVYRITPDGEVQPFAQGLGRAQGLAFDTAHNLYVVAYYAGEGGVVRITPAGEVEHVISGISLVGLAFGLHGELILADNSTLYTLAFGVQGRPLP